METEFWGVEVKSGEPLKVSPGYGRVLHLSQASLGAHKNEKGKESVSLYVNVDGKDLVLGTLITNKLPQHQFDLLFDRDFELSHDWKSGSVYFYGYKASNSSAEDESLDGESDESESEEAIPVTSVYNGKRESKAKQEKSEFNAKQENTETKAEKETPESNAKQENPEAKAEKAKPESKATQEKPESKATPVKPESKAMQEKPESKTTPAKPVDDEKTSDAGRDPVKIVQPHKVIILEEEESSYEDTMSEDGIEDKSQVETSKKRPIESANKKPDPKKKAKVTPQETGSNKTESLPGNNVPKNPADNSKVQPPKPYACKICKKAFSTEHGVEAHTKDKHKDGEGS